MKHILFSFIFSALSLTSQAGEVCKDANPVFTGQSKSLLEKIANLKVAAHLGDCDVKIWFHDVCDETTHAFLYRGVDVVIGKDPNPYALRGYDHYDTFLWNFAADGSMILDSDIQKFSMDSEKLNYDYHEKGWSTFLTQLSFSDKNFTRLEFTGLESDQSVFEHLICGK